MNEILPFNEYWISEKESIRVFKSDVFDEELKWHFDDEDRIIECIGKSDWKFQFDDNLPMELKGPIKIKRGEYHRLIKGSGDLKISIKRI
jgi:hypothetical protein